MTAQSLDKRNNRVALYAFLGACAMLGLGYASVPLYDLFCRVTGFGGTPQVASEAKAAGVSATAVPISIRFDANIDPGMGWSFEPEQVTQQTRIGERQMAIYVARNDTDQPITGQASYNVEPEQAGYYFNKIECFCFTEQTLQPGQEVRMPVIYYIDPEFLKNPNTKAIEQVTLSYTFHRKQD
jgi:cytochrome c oxidase assembly protein subunit 11